MSVDPVQNLVDELARDLSPVRPLPALRWSALGLGLAWVAFLLVVLGAMGLRAELWMALTQNAGFAATLGGLLLAAAGGSIAGLASRIPGRERAAWGGLAVALGGLATAAGLCLSLLASSGLDQHGPASAGMCLENAVMLAVVPAAVLVALVVRGWVERPWLAAAAGMLGIGAVAGLAVHLHCGMAQPLHLLVGHALAPLLIMTLAAPLAAWVLRTSGR